MTAPAPRPCPLCAAAAAHLAVAAGRAVHLCPECGLAFVAPADHPTPAAAAARYAHHHNDLADPGYRAHLARLADPLCARLAAPARGLDYGAGPTPALAALLRARGHEVAVYDPIFSPDEGPLAATYDFVTCCEVAEHFRAPGEDFARLARCLAPGGWLAVMTQPLRDPADLATWWYARDPTHLAFYQPRTLAWLARRHGWVVETPDPAVTLFHAATP